MDHDGVLVLEREISIDNIASVPLVSKLKGQGIRCTSLRAGTEVPAPKPNAAPSRWKTGVMGILGYFSPPIENSTAPQPAEQEWSHPVKDLPPAASGFDSPIHDDEDLCITDDDESEPEDRTCRWCSEDLSHGVHWSWHNAICPQQRSTSVVMHINADHQPEQAITGLGSRMTLHEVLDHALFGPQELDLAPLFGNFPLQTVVEPVPSAPGLVDIAWYHRNVLNNSLRRSTRNRPAASVPDVPGSVSPVVSTSGSDDSDSDWETTILPEAVVAADAPQRDHHVQAWIAVHASRHRSATLYRLSPWTRSGFETCRASVHPPTIRASFQTPSIESIK
jgi:hypothetical protein